MSASPGQLQPPPVRKVRLAAILLFTCLILAPPLGYLIYEHHRNEAAITASLDKKLHRMMAQSILVVSNLVMSAGNVMALVGDAVSADPAYFRSDESYGLIWHAVAAVDQIDALYVTFEDGFHRVVSRLDADRRAAFKNVPEEARWHASYIDDFSTGKRRSRHRRFSRDWPIWLPTRIDVLTDMDVRTTPQYRQAKQTLKLAIADPGINPDTGAPVMAMGWPVMVEGKFIGFVGAGMTLHLVSEYLRDHGVGPNSVSMIIDDSGRVIAHSEPKACVRVVGGQPAFTTVDQLADQRVTAALAHRDKARRVPYRFVSATGQELTVASRPFPAEFGKKWEILIVTPVDDFARDLRSASRTVTTMLAILVAMAIGAIIVLIRILSSSVYVISPPRGPSPPGAGN